jgi:hypothetical protein
MLMGLNLNINTELQLLQTIKSFSVNLASLVYSQVDIVDILISIEQQLETEPENEFLLRLKAFIRESSNFNF